MKLPKTEIIKVAILFALAGISACSGGSASTSNIAVNQTENKTVQKTAPEENEKTTIAKDNESPSVDLSTPTNAYKTAYAARKNKDLATLKKVMSKDAIEFMSIFVEPGKTIDNAFVKMTETPQAKTDESKNEKIDGDKATLEYPDETGKWRKMDFVKEGGEWKITMAKPKPEDIRIEN